MKDSSQKLNSKRERSAAYPAIGLELALDYSRKLLEAYRSSNFDRKSAAEGIGYKTITGDSGTKVAALVHFALLERVGNAYKNSDLAQRIYHYTDDEDKVLAIKIAAVSPKLFSKLIGEFGGQAIPIRLSSILVREHGINQKVAEKVAENFKTTMEYAQLSENGVLLKDFPQNQVTEGNVVAEDHIPSFKRSVVSDSTMSHASLNNFNKQAPVHPPSLLPLPIPDTEITILYPANLAYFFAIGRFAKELAAFGEAIKAATQEQKSQDTDPDSTSQLG